MLRDYQVEINQKSRKFLKSKEQRGQVYAPTGAGKTVCFIDLIKYAIKRGATNIAVIHPRIALSQDQLSRFKADVGPGVHYSSFHSGKHVGGNDPIVEVSTTDPDDIAKIINQTDRPHITFSSYQSFHKLNNHSDIKFDLVVCDEAHYLVSDRYNSMLPNFNADKVIFYTATPIIKDFIDGGMSDIALFGELIHSVVPKRLIKAGYIVAPLLQILNCETNNVGDVDVIDVVSRAYVEQFKRVTAWGMPYHQMLVAARGVDCDLAEISSRVYEIQDYVSKELGISGNDVDVYTIAANGVTLNGRPFNGDRAAALLRIKTSNRNSIVAHYDTLSEGIDIDTLSGCVIMRGLSKAKIIQTIGRCARPFKGDLDSQGNPRADIYNTDKFIDNRCKPRCLVTLPVVDNDQLAGPEARVLAEAFIGAGYDDLTTYLPPDADEPQARGSIDFNLGNDDVFTSKIKDYILEEELTNLKNLLMGV